MEERSFLFSDKSVFTSNVSNKSTLFFFDIQLFFKSLTKSLVYYVTAYSLRTSVHVLSTSYLSTTSAIRVCRECWTIGVVINFLVVLFIFLRLLFLYYSPRIFHTRTTSSSGIIIIIVVVVVVVFKKVEVIYIFFIIVIVIFPRCVKAKVLDGDIRPRVRIPIFLLCSFSVWTRYPPSYGLNSTTTALLQV